MPDPEETLDAYLNLSDDTYLAERATRLINARRLARLVDRELRPRGPILDIGAAAGWFVKACRERSLRAFGLEPSLRLGQEAPATARGILEEPPFAPGSLHGVTLWDVLEHVPDPLAALVTCRDLLQESGWVALNVPAIDSVLARGLGARWPLLLPEHLHYFTRKSLRHLLGASGFASISFHLHPVVFSAGYVAHRLGQHQLPLAGLCARTLKWLGAEGLPVPLVMGEVTALARVRPSA